MPGWDEVELTTPDTLARLEGEVNSLSLTGWQAKIGLARDFLKTRIELELKKGGQHVDYESGENLIDLVENPEIFAYASDFLTLYLIYQDLAAGNENSPYGWKMTRYKQEFEDKFTQLAGLIRIKTNTGHGQDLYLAGRFTR